MQQRRNTALKGVDPDRGRRERQSNIVAARTNAREERLNNRRRIAPDGPTMSAFFASDSTNDAKRSLDELPTNVRACCSKYTFLVLSAWRLYYGSRGVQGRHSGMCIGLVTLQADAC
jgi:hypothetical protein